MNEAQALTTIVESSHVELAVSGWLHAHEKSVRTHKAYAQTLDQFRRELHKIGKDLDTDVQTIMLVAQAFASASSKKGRAIIRKMYAWLSSVAFSTMLLNASCSCRWTIKAMC